MNEKEDILQTFEQNQETLHCTSQTCRFPQQDSKRPPLRDLLSPPPGKKAFAIQLIIF